MLWPTKNLPKKATALLGFTMLWYRQIIHGWNGNLSEIKILFRYLEIFRFRDFMSKFGEMVGISAIFRCPKELKTLRMWT